MNEYAVISRFSISPGTSRNLIRPGTMLMLVVGYRCADMGLLEYWSSMYYSETSTQIPVLQVLSTSVGQSMVVYCLYVRDLLSHRHILV